MDQAQQAQLEEGEAARVRRGRRQPRGLLGPFRGARGNAWRDESNSSDESESIRGHDEQDEGEEERDRRRRRQRRYEPLSRNKFALKNYDGSYDYSVFQVQFESVATANRWDIQEKKAALLAALSGNATEVISTLKQAGRPVTFRTLDETLERIYSHTPSLAERKHEFISLKQERNQSLRDFARIVERKGRAYHRNSPESDVQEALVECFIKGMQDRSAARQISFASASTIDDVLKILSRGLTIAMDHGEPSKKVRLTEDAASSSKPYCEYCDCYGHDTNDCWYDDQ